MLRNKTKTDNRNKQTTQTNFRYVTTEGYVGNPDSINRGQHTTEWVSLGEGHDNKCGRGSGRKGRRGRRGVGRDHGPAGANDVAPKRGRCSKLVNRC